MEDHERHELDRFESLMAENQLDLDALNTKRASEKIPTEGEWFALFSGIAESLAVQADFVRED